jgi:hypothetical protein
MRFNDNEIILLSELLIKVLKHDIEEKNKVEEIPPSFIEFKDLIKEKKKRGRPLGSYKKCNISSER